MTDVLTHQTDHTDTEPAETEGSFFAVEPLMGPLMEWKPEYGTIDDEGETTELGDGVFVYSSPNFAFHVNSVVVAGDDGVAVLDSQMLPRHARRILDEIGQITDQPVRYVTNSHSHPDHVFGNTVFTETGAELVSSNLTARLIDRTAGSDQLFMLGVYGEHMAEAYEVPRSTFVGSRELWLGRTAVQLFEFSDGSTVAGESVDMTFAWLPQSRVLHVADALEPGSHVLFAEGASIADWLVQLDHLRQLVKELQPRVIVPGHGKPGDAGIIDRQEQYLTTVAEMVEDHCRGGAVPLDDAGRDALRAEIDGAFPGYGNPMLLDISLEMIQLGGPVAFVNGRPDAVTTRRLPSFR